MRTLRAPRQTRPTVTGRIRRAPTACLLLAAGLGLARPTVAQAQFSEPCELSCIGVLGATGFVTATGLTVAYGRISGGMSSVNQGVFLWGGSFFAVTGAGMALAGDGELQERAVYASGIGVLTGALIGLTVETVRTGGDRPRILAGTLIGAAAGALVGGVYGALTHDDQAAGGPSVPLLTLTVPF